MNYITDFEPKVLWKYFDQICQIPHPSGKEEKIIEYLKQFGKQHNLETDVDEVGNVLIRKNATKGHENSSSLILQAHIDMVCEKNEGTEHDFDKDPISTFIDGDWLKAKGTTLGADDGIGVAAMLAILASTDIAHGKLECLFTVDEERGLTGAMHVKKGWLKSDLLLNLDSEEDGKFCIGCAGGIDTVATYTIGKENVDEKLFFLNVSVKGLRGGHSGDDINKGRGNAIKILSRFLWNQNKLYPVYIQSIKGGNLHNAIPREASAVIAIPYAKKEDIRVQLNLFSNVIENEFPEETELKLDLESGSESGTLLAKQGTDKLLYALYACPHGVIEMSKEIEGLPETSTNLASVKMPDEQTFVVATSQRSSVESKKIDIKDRIEAVFVLSGAQVKHSDGYPGWKPNLNSKIKNIVVDSYTKLFKQEPEVRAIHAGLECGLFFENYPKLDMISIGPDITGNHSPAEKCNIPTVEKFWKHLVDVLGKI